MLCIDLGLFGGELGLCLVHGLHGETARVLFQVGLLYVRTNILERLVLRRVRVGHAEAAFVAKKVIVPQQLVLVHFFLGFRFKVGFEGVQNLHLGLRIGLQVVRRLGGAAAVLFEARLDVRILNGFGVGLKGRDLGIQVQHAYLLLAFDVVQVAVFFRDVAACAQHVLQLDDQEGFARRVLELRRRKAAVFHGLDKFLVGHRRVLRLLAHVIGFEAQGFRQLIVTYMHAGIFRGAHPSHALQDEVRHGVGTCLSCVHASPAKVAPLKGVVFHAANGTARNGAVAAGACVAAAAHATIHGAHGEDENRNQNHHQRDEQNLLVPTEKTHCHD